MTGKKRDIRFDLLRIIAMLMVIAGHARPLPFENSAVGRSFLLMFICSCNGIFFMLSGYFNLSSRFETMRDYARYYIKRTGSVLIPYVTVLTGLTVWNMILDGIPLTPYYLAANTYGGILGSFSTTHLWFMYSLIGLLYVSPFLAKLCGAMSRNEHRLFFFLTMAWTVLRIFLTENLGIHFRYNYFLFADWGFYYYLGYYCGHVMEERERKRFLPVGIVCYVLSAVLPVALGDHYTHGRDFSPFMILQVMGIFLLSERASGITNPRLARITGFLAGQQYMVYLLHWHILIHVTPYLMTRLGTGESYVLCILITFLVSVSAAGVLNRFLFRPLQRLLERRLPGSLTRG